MSQIDEGTLDAFNLLRRYLGMHSDSVRDVLQAAVLRLREAEGRASYRAPDSRHVGSEVRREVRDVWREATNASTTQEAHRLLRVMVDRIGYGREDVRYHAHR